MTDPKTAPGFDEWCIVELLGHRKLAARVRETTIGGAGFLRLDEPDGRTQFVSPGSVYALHPATEQIVRAVADDWRTEPVTRYDLPEQWRKAIAAEEPAVPGTWLGDFDDSEGSEP